MDKTITIETLVNKDIQTVWDAWTKPEHITKWNFASPDWECPHAENDVVVGGKFLSRMSSKDGKESFDFVGTYADVKPHRLLTYAIADGRKVTVTFEPKSEQGHDGVLVTESFEMEDENSAEMQKAGWQAILNNFKAYTESLA